jgi:hypothetical protein
MAQRRVNEVAFNFDSLTDMVTNLAGGLILIVLLLAVLNRQRSVRAGAEAGEQARKSTTAGRSVELIRLKYEVAALEQDRLPELDTRIRNVRDEIEKLQREVNARQPLDAADPLGKPGAPSRVEFRPPLLKKATKPTGVVFVLLNRRIYWCIWSDYRSAYRRELDRIRKLPLDSDELRLYQEGVLKPLPTGDFDMQIIATNNQALPECKAVLKAGVHGEPIEHSLEPDSEINKLLDRFNPDVLSVDFDVFPDSFDLFVELRRCVMAKRFAYSWSPRAAGEPLEWKPGQSLTN